MLTTAVMGIARHVLTLVGGYLVAKGALDAAAAETLVGAGAAIIGVVWSVVEKKTR